MNLTATRFDGATASTTITKPVDGRTYVSPYGWSIVLPEGWSKLPDASKNVLTGFRPLIFSCIEDWSLAITWTRIRVPSYLAMQRFSKLIEMDGPVPSVDADDVLAGLIPLVGQTTKTEAYGVASGERAMEVIKLCMNTGVLPHRLGVDLLVAANDGRETLTETLYIDRLSFYANLEIFPHLLPEIKESLRSYRIDSARSK